MPAAGLPIDPPKYAKVSTICRCGDDVLLFFFALISVFSWDGILEKTFCLLDTFGMTFSAAQNVPV